MPTATYFVECSAIDPREIEPSEAGSAVVLPRQNKYFGNKHTQMDQITVDAVTSCWIQVLDLTSLNQCNKP